MRLLNGCKKVFLSGVIIALFQGCGGGDGIDGTGLRGTVAVGAALGNTEVVIRDVNGRRQSVTTDNDGHYAVTLQNMAPPFLLRAKTTETKSLYSIAYAGGVTNIHPISDLVLRNWFAVQDRDIDQDFESDETIVNAPAREAIDANVVALEALLASLYDELGVASDFDFLNSEFDADGTGFDQVLDQLHVSYNRYNVTVNIINPQLNIQGTLLRLDLGNSLADEDALAPQQVQDVVALNAGQGKTFVLWNVATDNIGVAAYNVYRDDVLLGATPYPVFVDSGLTSGVQYCYVVEAVDGAGNRSEKSAEACVTAQNDNDTQAPAPISQLSVTSHTSSSLSLQWTASPSNDVRAYTIYRRLADETASRIASVFATGFEDNELRPDTQYCYGVSAVDAVGNESAMSDFVCATTLSEDPADTRPPVSSVSPVGGSYTAPILVSLRCDDGYGSGCRAIHYTLDGSEPGLNSTVYTSAFRLEQDTELRFFGVDRAGNREAPANRAHFTFNDSQSSSAKVGFANASYSATEADGGVLVQVIRSGDASSALSVNFQTADVSAIAGEDYESVSGTLSWAAGDAQNKEIVIPVRGDKLNEADETFMITLDSLAGNASLGVSSTIVRLANRSCDGVIDSDIRVNTTISAPCNVVTRDISVENNANLSILPGVTLIFNSNAGIRVQSDGSLTANGQAQKPIFMTAASHTPGYWNGIIFYGSNNARNQLSHAYIEYAGNSRNGTANIVSFGGTTRLQLRHLHLRHSSAYGLELYDGTLLDAFSGNRLYNNDTTAKLPANLFGKLDTESVYAGNTKDYIATGSNQRISDPQTWRAIGVPYRSGTIIVETDLVLAAGAKLIFETNGSMRVESTGSLRAIGTESRPILLTAVSPTPGTWNGLGFYDSNSVNNALEYVTIEYGGRGDTNGDGNLYTYHQTNRLSVKNSTLRKSGAYGFDFYGDGNIITFENNSITENEGASGRIEISSVHVLNDSSSFTGNTFDKVEITNNQLVQDSVWQAIGVDYHYSNTLNIRAALSVSPGVTMVADSNVYINVDSDGTFSAVGETDTPIVFTSKNQSPGAWGGIQFVFTDSIDNRISNSVIEFAGSTVGQKAAAITLYGSNSGANISDNDIVNSGDMGIWVYNGANTYGVDLLARNSFVNIPADKQVVYGQ
ncbi:MAG: chitobiase/beta-hexosaminidase C-terminal domain-containing protein [Gammaproteobacteria bacterium]|nr:chitobiase/beta-hexosaminidase C-terminal domain-containing protein [Gammaproteobacteria bacterium]